VNPLRSLPKIPRTPPPQSSTPSPRIRLSNAAVGPSSVVAAALRSNTAASGIQPPQMMHGQAYGQGLVRGLGQGQGQGQGHGGAGGIAVHTYSDARAGESRLPRRQTSQPPMHRPVPRDADSDGHYDSGGGGGVGGGHFGFDAVPRHVSNGRRGSGGGGSGTALKAAHGQSRRR
jgi:hypothetical protein